MSAAVERMPNQVAELRVQLGAMEDQFKAALPSHMPVERFMRVVMTAVQNNPELVECERRSLWNAAMKAAQDGLLPDGREGAMVVRKSGAKKMANWQPMIGGIRKKARNSGEISTWDAHVVHENDAFEFELGDEPFIRHRPALENGGKIIAAYSICTLKDGSKSREVMSIGEIHAIRDRSDAWKAYKAKAIKSTPWATDEGEMCRKTVARRHSKVIPMSSDLDDLIRRDDDLYEHAQAADDVRQVEQPRRGKSITDQLDDLLGATGVVIDMAATTDQPAEASDKALANGPEASAQAAEDAAPDQMQPEEAPSEEQDGASDASMADEEFPGAEPTLIDVATDMAAKGRVAFDSWYASLKPAAIETLKPHLKGLMAAANAATAAAKKKG